MKYVIALCLLVITTSVCNHPLHISYTKVSIQNKTVTVVVKVNPDDFKQAVSNYYQCENCSDVQMQQYILQRCKISTSEEPINLNFLKKEIKDDAIAYYFIGSISKLHPTDVSVENTMFCNIYNDQKNLVIINYEKQEEGFNLDNVSKICKLSIK